MLSTGRHPLCSTPETCVEARLSMLLSLHAALLAVFEASSLLKCHHAAIDVCVAIVQASLGWLLLADNLLYCFY